MKAAAIGILRVDDDGIERYEKITIGDEVLHDGGSLAWKETVKEIEILYNCLHEHGGTCEECAWDDKPEVTRYLGNNAECQEERT